MSEIQGIGRFKFHEVGKLEEFKRLSAQAMEIVRAKDNRTLQYEIYFSDDQSECRPVDGSSKTYSAPRWLLRSREAIRSRCDSPPDSDGVGSPSCR
jgi:hypothetical protein